MKALRTALIGIAIIGLGSGIAIAQPASESAGATVQSAPAGPSQRPMMGGGMMHGGMMGGGMGPGGCGMMEMHRMGGMEMMPMMPMVMEEMRRDPKLRGRMMELRGEMLRTIGQALIDRGKQMQQGGGSQMRQGQ
jgi:hypothetical protein